MTPPASFDAIAPYYQYLEFITFGRYLQRCRIAHLDALKHCQQALVLGDGDGRFLRRLLEVNDKVHIVSNDLSPGMTALASKRVRQVANAAGRVQFIIGDARTSDWPGSNFDLVVTNFFVDCFSESEIAGLIDRVLTRCPQRVLWLDGDFRVPAGFWSQRLAQFLLAGMYAAFRLSTGLAARRLASSATIFASRGLTIVSEQSWLGGFLSSRLWQRI